MLQFAALQSEASKVEQYSAGDSISQAQRNAPSYNDMICSHLHQCFAQGLYSDLNIRLHSSRQNQSIPDGTILKAHRVLVMRSPYLSSLILERSNQISNGFPLEIDITICDPFITTHGLSIALGHLYGSFPLTFLTAGSPGISQQDKLPFYKSVLASASLLMLPDLVSLSYRLVKGCITLSTLLSYIDYVNQECFNGLMYMNELRADVLHYLLTDMIEDINIECECQIWQDKNGKGYSRLVELISCLPFEWFKKVVECNQFIVPSDRERFLFAKDVVKYRKIKGLSMGDENVLMAFGGAALDGNTLVNVVRKAIKQPSEQLTNERKVWKVGE